jgi:hypothetical protein
MLSVEICMTNNIRDKHQNKETRRIERFQCTVFVYVKLKPSKTEHK